jgi:Undecaprenyl-phosphate glucose phosphotransferase
MSLIVQETAEVRARRTTPLLTSALASAREPATSDRAFARPAEGAASASVARGDRRGPLRPKSLLPARSRLSGVMIARMIGGLDLVVILAATVAVVSRGAPATLLAAPLRDLLPLVVGCYIAFWTLRVGGAYDLGRREGLVEHVGRIAMGAVAASAAALCLGVALGPDTLHAAGLWVTIWVLALLATHICAWATVRHWRAQGRLTPNVVIVGATENAFKLVKSALDARDVAVLGVFDDRLDRAPQTVHGVPVLGDTSHLLEHRILPYVDRIVITVTAASQPRVRQLIDRLRFLPNAVTLFWDVDGQDTRSATLERLARLPLAEISGADDADRRVLLKRIQDLVLGAAALLVAAPVMAIVAIAVRLDSPGPILFRQQRHGFNNEPITVWKFRSMRHELADPNAAQQVCACDERVTRVGSFIRKTSLDELPQLINVLRGEMSLVGPRPHAIGMKTGSEESSHLVAEYAWRHRMKPGITGWAQINGSRGPVDTPEAVRERVALDIDYIERQSFWFDVYILAMTLPTLFGDRHQVR